MKNLDKKIKDAEREMVEALHLANTEGFFACKWHDKVVLDQFVFGSRPEKSIANETPVASNLLQRMLDRLQNANILLEKTIAELRPIKNH